MAVPFTTSPLPFSVLVYTMVSRYLMFHEELFLTGCAWRLKCVFETHGAGYPAEEEYHMTELTYLPEVECEVSVPNGMFGSAVVGVPDERGNKQFLRVPPGYLTERGGK